MRGVLAIDDHEIEFQALDKRRDVRCYRLTSGSSYDVTNDQSSHD